METKALKPLTKAEKRRLKHPPKPPFPTLLKRSTADNLRYLVDHKAIEVIESGDILVAKSTRRPLGDGTFVKDNSPTGGA